ncbi:MAG: SpoVG family protein [Planctomycetota bacterium]|nr:SpoVG family protein [Planctomycetota bacterium]
MEITETSVKLVDQGKERLLAFCTVTFKDAFVVRDVKIIDGPRGPFVAMPSRKVMDRCGQCHSKNHLRAVYCNECGQRLDPTRAPEDARGRPRLHVDVAHPINQECRAEIESQILHAYDEECQLAEEPGYVTTSLGDDHDFSFDPSPYASPDEEEPKELQAG